MQIPLSSSSFGQASRSHSKFRRLQFGFVFLPNWLPNRKPPPTFFHPNHRLVHWPSPIGISKRSIKWIFKSPCTYPNVTPLVRNMQQHSSNTSSRAYKAIKYSRLYPSSNEAASQQAPEWQHYRGPSLRVILDITKTPPLNDPSYRLRIIMETDGHSGAQPTPYAVGQGTPDIVLVGFVI